MKEILHFASPLSMLRIRKLLSEPYACVPLIRSNHAYTFLDENFPFLFLLFRPTKPQEGKLPIKQCTFYFPCQVISLTQFSFIWKISLSIQCGNGLRRWIWPRQWTLNWRLQLRTASSHGHLSGTPMGGDATWATNHIHLAIKPHFVDQTSFWCQSQFSDVKQQLTHWWQKSSLCCSCYYVWKGCN